MTDVIAVDDAREPEVVRDTINTWASNNTSRRITEIIAWDLDPLTHLLLSNAVFFKGSWARQFDPARTAPMAFHTSRGATIEVEMMHQLGEFGIGYTQDADILVLHYVGGRLSMVIVLPFETLGLATLERQMTGTDLGEWAEETWTNAADMYLPRFTLESAFDLIEHDDLIALGMTDAVSARLADFSGVARPRKWLYPVHFVHKAFVDVNEEGTEAAAVTVAGCFPAGTPVRTAGGHVPIETLEPGRDVIGLDFADGSLTTSAVVACYSYEFSGEIVAVETECGSLQATWNHPFLVAQGEGLAARRPTSGAR
jgi:serine protease inhibitor